MSSSTKTSFRSSKYVRWIGLVVVLAIIWKVFPPFMVVSLDEEGHVPSDEEEVVFDTTGFADRFWVETLEPSMKDATGLGELASAVSADPVSAMKRFGRQAAEGAIVYYFAKGEGTVVEIKGRRAILEVGGVRVSLLIAPPVFGNTVRDGTGLLNVNDLPGLEEFNAVSAALNQKVENEVMLPMKDDVQVGDRVSIVGCSKAPATMGEGPVLEFTPFQVEVVP